MEAMASAHDTLVEQLPILDMDGISGAERAAAVADPAYWQALCPDLHVGHKWNLAKHIIDPDPDMVDECRSTFMAVR